MRSNRSWPPPAVLVFVGSLLGIASLPCPSLAQSAESISPPATQETNRATQPTRLYLGMWTMHMREPEGQVDNNWLVGIVYRGFFGGTFVNSFGKRAYTAGIQRSIVNVGQAESRAEIGYRIGAISGYDGRFGRFARKSPVLPIGTIYGIVEYRRVGVEMSYTFVVVSGALTYRF